MCEKRSKYLNIFSLCIISIALCVWIKLRLVLREKVEEKVREIEIGRG
jgi:hypothetical protein